MKKEGSIIIPSMDHTRFYVAAFLSLILISACGDSSGDSSGCEGDRDGAVVVNVTCDESTRPLYDWDVEPEAWEVRVERVGNGQLAWRLSSLSLNNIIPTPLRHGDFAIIGTEFAGDEEELQAGVEYEVEVIILTGQSPSLTGTRKFITPLP